MDIGKIVTAGVNKATKTSLNTLKLDQESEDFSLPTVAPTVSKTIQQARQALGLTQKDLATKINEKPQVVGDYESGRAGVVPNQAVLGKMERVLGVKLRGKDIGKPLAPRGAGNKK